MRSKIALRGATAMLALSGAVIGGTVVASGANAYDVSVWDKVAYCESTNNWSINTGNGFYGGLQFTISTWNEFGGQAYADRADHASKAEQIAIARRVLAGQGPTAWPVCSIQAGLTKTSGGADPNATPDGSSSSSSAIAYSSSSNNDVSTTSSVDYSTDILDVDGVMGPLTITEMQKWSGSDPDGIWGPRTSRALQSKVGADVTGVRDSQTTEAVQEYVGADVDGIWGRQTTSFLQRFLNQR